MTRRIVAVKQSLGRGWHLIVDGRGDGHYPLDELLARIVVRRIKGTVQVQLGGSNIGSSGLPQAIIMHDGIDSWRPEPVFVGHWGAALEVFSAYARML